MEATAIAKVCFAHCFRSERAPSSSGWLDLTMPEKSESRKVSKLKRRKVKKSKRHKDKNVKKTKRQKGKIVKKLKRRKVRRVLSGAGGCWGVKGLSGYDGGLKFAHMVQMSVVAAKRGMSSVHVRASELYSLDMHQGPAARRIPIYAVDSD